MHTDKKEVLRELLLSENRGYVPFIKVRGISRVLKTAVKHVDHHVIVLETTCIYGYPLEKTVLTLLDIEWVKRCKVLYSSPVYESIRAIKDNIRVMRNNIGIMNPNQSLNYT